MKLTVKFVENEMTLAGDFGQTQVVSDGGYERGYADGVEYGYNDGYEKGFARVESVMEEIENGSY